MPQVLFKDTNKASGGCGQKQVRRNCPPSLGKSRRTIPRAAPLTPVASFSASVPAGATPLGFLQVMQEA